MKKLRLLVILGMFTFSQSHTWSQVFGYPGATWVFSLPQSIGLCFEVKEKWVYTGDTVIGGDAAKRVSVTYKYRMPPAFAYWNTSHYDQYFKVEGDTVSVWNAYDTAWYELYNFSLQTGDTTHSPLYNKFGFGFDCNQPELYNF